MPEEEQKAFFARFIEPLKLNFGAVFALDHERAKYSELFSILYLRTGTSTLKEAFKALKEILDTKASSN